MNSASIACECGARLHFLDADDPSSWPTEIYCGVCSREYELWFGHDAEGQLIVHLQELAVQARWKHEHTDYVRIDTQPTRALH